MRDPSSSIELVFRFLDSRRYRGNLRRAAQQGLVLAPSAIVGLALQINKRLDATGLVVLAGLLLVSELYLLIRPQYSANQYSNARLSLHLAGPQVVLVKSSRFWVSVQI